MKKKAVRSTKPRLWMLICVDPRTQGEALPILILMRPWLSYCAALATRRRTRVRRTMTAAAGHDKDRPSQVLAEEMKTRKKFARIFVCSLISTATTTTQKIAKPSQAQAIRSWCSLYSHLRALLI